MKNGKRCAVVTGAARGIGRGISLALAENGYAVFSGMTSFDSAFVDAAMALSLAVQNWAPALTST